MVEAKAALMALANMLGFGSYIAAFLQAFGLLGTIEPQNNWERTILFLAGFTWMIVKIIDGIINLLKKKLIWTKNENCQGIGVIN